ncbi:MAG TPA: PepSY-associated TM helix domain-containing protein [Methylophilaceae bacterium]|nr:PepSY-associated TM helix domain-containing protein [Methylophilaceae bacterium]
MLLVSEHATRLRRLLVLIHRYVGLALALFIAIAGLSGSLLVFEHELDEAINPHLMRIQPLPGAVPVDFLKLRERVQAGYPDAKVHRMDLASEPGKALSFRITASGNDQVFVDPYTGRILGERKWGDISQGMVNLMPFIYRLHQSLVLGSTGTLVLGIVALLWFLDCFVGAYLTLPSMRRRGDFGSAEIAKKKEGLLARWSAAWKVRWHGGSYKLNFDLHRAGGLWLWAMLAVMAWSSVGFNLREVYRPVMATAFTLQPSVRELPNTRPQSEPGISWYEAHRIGKTLMNVEARTKGFAVQQEQNLSYDAKTALFRYRVKSDRDIRDHGGSTSIWFDANTGERKAAYIPSGEANGDTVSGWLFALHMAAIWGLPYKLFVLVTGLVVTMLSVTGVTIWARKRSARKKILLT